MIKLDDDLLVQLGLAGLPADDKKRMLTHIYETLEMRVGMELAKQMSDAQLTEFEQFINRNDEAGALKWLETNFPNYKEVVAAEFEKLKAEIKQVAPQILQDALAAAQQPQIPQQPTGSQMPPQQMPPQGAPMSPQQPYYAPQPQPGQQYMQPGQQQPYYPQQPQPQQTPAPGYYAAGQPAPGQQPPYPPQQ
jgi:hypothetical protein